VALAPRTLASNTATTNGATTLSVSPTGMQENDWLIFSVCSAGGTGAHSNTAGSATRVHNDLAGGTVIVTSTWKKKCGPSESGPYTFSFGGSTRRAVILCRAYSGGDPTDIVEEAPTQVSGNSVSSLAVTGVDPAATGGLHVVLGFSRTAAAVSQDFTEPTNYPIQLETGSSSGASANAFAAWFERALPDASATGSITFTTSVADRLNGASILLKPQALISQNVNQATETDVAQPVGKAKSKTTGQTTDTSVSRPIGKTKTKTSGQVAELSVARPIARLKSKTLSTVVDTAVSRTVTGIHTKTINQTSETSVARTVTVIRSGVLTQVVQTNTARPLAVSAHSKTIGLASDTSLARTVGHSFARALSAANETDLARSLGSNIVQPLGRTTESSIAHAVGAVKLKQIQFALDEGIARPLQHVKITAAGIVLDTQVANTLSAIKQSALLGVVETSLAHILSVQTFRELLTATETDIAKGLTKHIALGTVSETDIALGLAALLGESGANKSPITLHPTRVAIVFTQSPLAQISLEQVEVGIIIQQS
jgi:hypothetical protein